jgi:hypothetical protein
MNMHATFDGNWGSLSARAFAEAGRAVASHLLGLDLRRVSLERDQRFRLPCWFRSRAFKDVRTLDRIVDLGGRLVVAATSAECVADLFCPNVPVSTMRHLLPESRERRKRSHWRMTTARVPGLRQLGQILRQIFQRIFRQNVASLPERPAEFARATLRSTVSDVQRHATATAQRRALRRKEQPPWDYRRAVRVLRQAGLSGRRFHTVRIVPESLSVARHSLSALDSRGLAQKVGPGGVPNLHHVVAL